MEIVAPGARACCGEQEYEELDVAHEWEQEPWPTSVLYGTAPAVCRHSPRSWGDSRALRFVRPLTSTGETDFSSHLAGLILQPP